MSFATSAREKAKLRECFEFPLTMIIIDVI